MSTQWIVRLPSEILLLTIGAINDRNDLLSFALTCRFICQLIIPDKLEYFRISNLMENTDVCNHLVQNLHLCRGTHEFEFTDGVRVTRARQRQFDDSIYATIVKISWRNGNFEPFRTLLDALVGSGCRLEEFHITLCVPSLGMSIDSTLLVTVTKLEDLQIWKKLDRTALQKLSIWIGTYWDRISFPLSKANWLSDMLTDTSKLTHLNLTIQHTAFGVNLLDYTWPNLENLIIGRDNIIPTTALRPRSDLINFFKRHPKLTTLSLPCDIHPLTNSPWIVVECLPNLESFAYEGTFESRLSEVLSPASARRLRHLTICPDVREISFHSAEVTRPNDLDIYKELTSLQTFCFTLGTHTSDYSKTNPDRILEVLAVHATGLHKIHLPMTGDFSPTYYDTTLSILQRFPKLTHLSGVWASDISRRDLLLQKLYQCRQLEYAIYGGRGGASRVFRLIREFESEDEEKHMFVEVISRKNPDCDMRTWGKFYNKYKV
ncbi:hypothetical protein Clacol_007128 [Clathrus columnatus]|uniref:F-box domain-containing protein n=1 Tax=Clathrus columnatus TaxID=1419009 RepID=A0AAV5AGW8_9AGAM|nr:hypothetical protein Clacol_007128 [Clathrus columnatus]